MRHPLYSGNFLILLGIVVVFNNIWAYLLLLLPFAYLYYVITAVDEQQMIQYFGPDYLKYQNGALPRFWPAWRKLRTALNTTAPFRWALAWRKEYGSCCAWLTGIAGLVIYKEALARGYSTGKFPALLLALCATIGIVITLRTKWINDRRRSARSSARNSELMPSSDRPHQSRSSHGPQAKEFAGTRFNQELGTTPKAK